MAKIKKNNATSKPFKRSLVIAKPIKTSWDKKMALKTKAKLVKAAEEEVKAEKIAVKQEKRRRQEENKKRRAENTAKAEMVQKITNLKKLKRGTKRIKKVA